MCENILQSNIKGHKTGLSEIQIGEITASKEGKKVAKLQQRNLQMEK